jgi:hypothetical protein
MKNLFLMILLVCATSYATAQTTYLHCGKLIDGVSETVKTEMTIVIEGNKIVKVEKWYNSD